MNDWEIIKAHNEWSKDNNQWGCIVYDMSELDNIITHNKLSICDFDFPNFNRADKWLYETIYGWRSASCVADIPTIEINYYVKCDKCGEVHHIDDMIKGCEHCFMQADSLLL